VKRKPILWKSLFVVFCAAVCILAVSPVAAQTTDSARSPDSTQLTQSIQLPHPAIGSWFGKAVQVCASAATCFNVTLFMSPTLTQDYNFVAGDTLELGGPPFGPHTSAHGRWIPTSSSSIIADYVFMLPGSAASNISVVRFRWQATATDYNTMQGWVNATFGPYVPVAYESLTASQFPTIPNEASFALTPPINFYTDATACPSGPPACPLIFKFTIKRVQP
jgi:hypothetical protein